MSHSFILFSFFKENAVMVKTMSECNHWVAWFKELLLLIVFTHSALKPVMSPVIKQWPFNIFWAAPTTQRQHFFNVDLNLQLFNIISNLLETQSGSTIAIVYPNGLGYYPYFSPEGKSFNERILQNICWMKHMLESRLVGETSITSDRQMTSHL